MPARESNEGPRIAIVGTGNIASLNVAGYLEDERCRVVAVCDTLESRAIETAEAWGVPRVYTDLDALLADPGIDAVEILTPTHLHYDHMMAALAAGKHVSCQKPLANSVAEALAMDRAAADAGLILRVSECFRHYPPLELAKKLIAEGAIGRPNHFRMNTVVGQTDSAFQTGLEADGYTWRFTSTSPGGHLFDDMIHKYAVALWLFDQDIVSVQAAVRRRDVFFEPCSVIFEYEDPGLLGTMDVVYSPSMWMRSDYYGADEFFEIHGDEGFLWVTRSVARPPRRGPLRRGPRPPDHHLVHRRGCRLGHRVPAVVPPLRGRPGERHPGPDDRHRGGQGPPALLRRLPGRQLPAPGRPPHHHRHRLARRVARVTAPK
jgi:predicted dehydrogenase